MAQKKTQRDRLNPKQRRFVAAYVGNLGNGKQAAIKAGYTERSAEVTASKLLRLPKVQAAVVAAGKKQEDRLGYTSDDILAELARVGFADLGQAYDKDGHLLSVQDMPENIRRAVAGMEVEALFEGSGRERMQVGTTTKVKTWDKLKALELLGKNKKLFVDRVEHSGSLTYEQLVIGSMGEGADE